MSKECIVCDDNGFVLLKDEDGTEKILYCTQCKRGNQYRYDGRTSKKVTNYYIEPITKVFEIDSFIARKVFEKGGHYEGNHSKVKQMHLDNL